jgi:general secretion pathway protein D
MNMIKRLPVLAPAAFCAIAPLLAHAQVGPATQPAGPERINITTTPTQGRNGPTTQISLNFDNATIDAVLTELSKAAGVRVLKELDGPAVGRISLMSQRPMSPDEAMALFNSAIQRHGYVAIKQGDTVRITTKDKAKTGAIPVYFGADPTKIAQNDDMITQVVPLKTVDAVKLKADLAPVAGADTIISSNANSNTLLITDTSAKVRRIVEIIANMDKRDALENTILVKQLKYADASAAARLVTDIFKTEEQGQQGNVQGPGAFFRAMQQGGRGGGGGQGGQSEEEKGRTGKVVASSDTRTNTVVVSGPAETLKAVETMLEKLDANPASEATFFHYSLKNGQAANMATVLNSLFGVSGGSSGGRSGTGTYGSNAGQRTSTGGTTGNTQRSSTFGGGGTSSSSSGSFGNFGNTQTISRSTPGASGGGVSVPSNVSGAANQLAGQVYVVADPDTNSLLVSTASKYEQQVRDIISELDRPVPQVLMKVMIAEVTHNNSTDFGVDFSILNTRASGLGQSGTTTFPPVPSGGLVVSVLEEHVQATIRALATAGKLDILSRPYILTSDNQQARIMVGQYVPYITDTRITDAGQQINSIDYRDIGIILNVTPHINPDGLVICDVAPEISSISDQTIPISSTVNATVFNSRSADTRVGIKNGETIVIGGLMQDQKTETISKVPILGDIPVLRFLFSRTQLSKTKTELLIFLTPHVAATPDILKGQTQDEMRGTKLVPNAVQPGTFQDHLKGMQRGATTIPSTPVSPKPTIDPQDRRLRESTPLPGTGGNRGTE